MQLVGQVIQALGGEAVPLTENAKPLVTLMNPKNSVGVRMENIKVDPKTGKVEFEGLPGVSVQMTRMLENAREQREAAVKQLEDSLKSLKSQSIPAAPAVPEQK